MLSLDTTAFATPVIPALLWEKWTFQLAMFNVGIRPHFRAMPRLAVD